MVTLDDKFSSFSKLVLDKANHTFEEQVHLMDLKNQEQLEQFKNDLENKSKELKSKTQQQAQHEKKLLVSKAQLERKRKVMTLKDELMENLVQKVRQELDTFSASPQYVSAINDRLELFREGLMEIDSAVVQLSAKDLTLHQAEIKARIESEFPHLQGHIEFEPLAPEYIGGFILFNGSRTIRYDATLKALLEDWMDRIGEMLHDTLNKVGMNNG